MTREIIVKKTAAEWGVDPAVTDGEVLAERLSRGAALALTCLGDKAPYPPDEHSAHNNTEYCGGAPEVDKAYGAIMYMVRYHHEQSKGCEGRPWIVDLEAAKVAARAVVTKHFKQFPSDMSEPNQREAFWLLANVVTYPATKQALESALMVRCKDPDCVDGEDVNHWLHNAHPIHVPDPIEFDPDEDGFDELQHTLWCVEGLETTAYWMECEAGIHRNADGDIIMDSPDADLPEGMREKLLEVKTWIDSRVEQDKQFAEKIRGERREALAKVEEGIEDLKDRVLVK